MIKTIQSTALRKNFKSALAQVKESKEPMVITERGVATTVLVSIDEYEDFLSSRDPQFLESIRQARSEYKKSDVFSFDDVFGNI